MHNKTAIVIDLGWEQLPHLEFMLKLSGLTVRYVKTLDEALNRILMLQATEQSFSLIVVAGCHDENENLLSFRAELERQKVGVPLLVIDRSESWTAEDFEEVLSSFPFPERLS